MPRGSPEVSWPLELQNSAAENSYKGTLGTAGRAPDCLPFPSLPRSLPQLTHFYCCGCQLPPPHLLLLTVLTWLNYYGSSLLLTCTSYHCSCLRLKMIWPIDSEEASSEPGAYKQDVTDLGSKVENALQSRGHRTAHAVLHLGLSPSSETYQPLTQGSVSKPLNLSSTISKN